MSTQPQPTVSELFSQATDDGIRGTIHVLVNTLLSNKKQKRAFFNKLSGPEQEALKKAMDRAMMAQAPARRYMTDLGKEYGLGGDLDPVYTAKPKNLDQATAKGTQNRRQDDLTRGRLYFEDASDLLAFTKNIYVRGRGNQKKSYIPHLENDRDAETLRIRETWISKKKPGKQAEYKPGTLDETIAFPRPNGFTGVIMFSVLSDLRTSGVGKKSPNKAPFEIQLMLRCDQETNRHSHALYDLMRLLKETPGFYTSKVEDAVMQALIEGNRALWDVSGYETGLLYGRSVPPTELKKEDAEAAIEILEKFIYYLTPRLGFKGARLLHEFINAEFPEDKDKDNFMKLLQSHEMSEQDFRIVQEKIEGSELDVEDKRDLKKALRTQKKKWDESGKLLRALDTTVYAINKKRFEMPYMLRDYKKYADPNRRFDPPEKEDNKPEPQT